MKSTLSKTEGEYEEGLFGVQAKLAGIVRCTAQGRKRAASCNISQLCESVACRENHCLRVEIAYHNEPRLGKGKILHYHVYDERFSKNALGEFSRSQAIRITKKMSIYKKYQKYFRGVTL